ncbi:MAG TPA: hypothetical protein VM513_03800 [Kofleriaceae bacterium]|jgi:hypothetical protein|nr:hypothetical protein [Kofleriaceae bacterium]
MRTAWVTSIAMGFALPASAEVRATASTHAQAPSRHLFYVEAFGKGGLYGLGYELAITPRLSLGAAGSFAVVREQQVLTLAPYVHATLVRGERNALFTDVGALFARSHIPSPVEGWDGMTDSGGGGFVSLGWERATRHLVLRASGSVVAGEGGVTPWAGFAIGVRP